MPRAWWLRWDQARYKRCTYIHTNTYCRTAPTAGPWPTCAHHTCSHLRSAPIWPLATRCGPPPRGPRQSRAHTFLHACTPTQLCNCTHVCTPAHDSAHTLPSFAGSARRPLGLWRVPAKVRRGAVQGHRTQAQGPVLHRCGHHAVRGGPDSLCICMHPHAPACTRLRPRAPTPIHR